MDAYNPDHTYSIKYRADEEASSWPGLRYENVLAVSKRALTAILKSLHNDA